MSDSTKILYAQSVKEQSVGVLMIRCPKTERSISTGIYIDRVAFRSMPVFYSSTFCPVCRTSHEWFAASAWVCDYGPENCDPSCQRCKMPLRYDQEKYLIDSCLPGRPYLICLSSCFALRAFHLIPHPLPVHCPSPYSPLALRSATAVSDRILPGAQIGSC